MRTTKQKNRANRKRRAALAIARSAPAPAHNEPSKRTRMDDTVSPRGDRKKQKLDNTRRAPGISYADMVQSNLCVAVARVDSQQLTEEQATLVKRYLEKCILEDIKNPAKDFSPRFMGKPIIAEGVLKLWCEDEPSLKWLSEVTAKLPKATCPELNIIRQSDLVKKVRAALFIPDCTNTLEDTSLVLAEQNKWAHLNTWTVYSHSMQKDDILLLRLGIPEKLVPELIARERRLAHNLGSVYVRFMAEDGSLQDEPPMPRQTSESSAPTGPLEPQPGPSVEQVPEQLFPAASSHSSPIPSGSKPTEEMCVEQESEIDLLDSSEGEEGVRENQDVGDPSRLS